MTDIAKDYAKCTGAILEFSDGNIVESPIHHTVKFMAFLQEFSQNISLSFDQEEVMGRNDPISTYRNTKRTISLSWHVPAYDIWDAKLNQLKTRILMRLMYPKYENERVYDKESGLGDLDKTNLARSNKMLKKSQKIDTTFPKAIEGALGSKLEYLALRRRVLAETRNYRESVIEGEDVVEVSGLRHTQTMIQNPLIHIKFGNLIKAASGSDDKPLLGYIDNLSINPVLDAGFFVQQPGEIDYTKGVKVYESGGQFPKVYSLSCNFNVIHQAALGFGNGLPGMVYAENII